MRDSYYWCETHDRPYLGSYKQHPRCTKFHQVFFGPEHATCQFVEVRLVRVDSAGIGGDDE